MTTVAIIGLGSVGLPLCLAFARRGLAVIGIDIEPAKVEKLRADESYISHIPAAAIGEARAAGRFEPTADVAAVSRADAILICVPTPLTPNRTPDRTHHDVAGRRSVPIDTASDGVVMCIAREPYKTFDFSRLAAPVVDCRRTVTPSSRSRAYHTS
jgi:UDP-N-acetyl-D-mannosaminuronate dehydrogenase